MGDYILIGVGAFTLLTFIMETVVLAGNDWQVEKRKTPIYYLRYDQYTSNGEFCSGFWVVLMAYILGLVLSAVVIHGIPTLIGAFIFGVGSGLVSTACAVLLGIVLVSAAIVMLAATLMYLVIMCSDQVTNSKSATIQGAINWYNQLKEKYCPTITKKED